MATQFYARYVPPVNKKERTPTVADLVPTRKSKKRKRDAHEHVQNDSTIFKDLNLKHRPDVSASSLTAAGDVSGSQKVKSDGVENFKATTEQKLKPSDLTALREKKSKASPRVDQNRTISKSEVEEEDKTIAEHEGKDIIFQQDATTAIVHGPNDSEDIDDGSASKHRKILSKFQRSTRIAATASTKAKNVEDSGQDLKDVQLEEPVETHGLVPLPQPPEIPDTVQGPGISTLPGWLAHPTFVSSTATLPFKELPLSSSTLSSLVAKGYENAFAIQSAVLPMLLSGPKRYNGDLCIAAATGSGKTLGYVLPMVENLRDKPVTRLRGLIVVPTRELVTQVRATLDSCSAGSGLKIGTAVGSKSLKDEQALLMTVDQRYDPEGYKEQLRRQMDEEVDYMNWEQSEEDEEDDNGHLSGFVTEHVSAVDVLVCTPGRLVDHMKSTKGFSLDHVQWLVVDEADRLLDESFQQWVDIVVPALERKPRAVPVFEKLDELLHIHEPREIQKIILSATMTKDISKLIALRLRRPKLVVLETSKEVQGLNNAQDHTPPDQAAHLDLPASLKEVTIPIKEVEEKPLYLLKLLSEGYDLPPYKMPKTKPPARDVQKTRSEISDSSESESHSSTSSSQSDSGSDTSLSKESRVEPKGPSSSVGSDHTHGVLVFTNNNENALRLARLLSLLRPAWAKHISSLTKSTATSAGRKALAAFRNRKLSVLIASDRASRGLDIENLAHVINYDMPTSLTSYVHRVGRTARAGKTGTATTLVAHHEGRWFTKEIVKSKLIRRANKVTRKEWLADTISNNDREQYEEALSRLGIEARGEAP